MLSFESEDDHRNGFLGDMGVPPGADGNMHGEMDEYEDFDNIDASGNSFTEEESCTCQNGNHNHNHNHGPDRFIHTHPMGIAHLPIHV